MISEGALGAARARAESLMTDTVRVEYASGTTFSEANGTATPAYTTRFSSKAKVQARNRLVALEEQVGGRTAVVSRVEIHLPASAGAVKVGDFAVVTAVGSLSDAQLLGRRFRIVAPVGKSFATARRFDVEEVVS